MCGILMLFTRICPLDTRAVLTLVSSGHNGWMAITPFPHCTAGFGFKEFLCNGFLWAGCHTSTGTSLSLMSLSLSLAHLHLWLWNISCPLRLFNGLQISHGAKQSLHLVFSLHFGKWGAASLWSVWFTHLATWGFVSNLHQEISIYINIQQNNLNHQQISCFFSNNALILEIVFLLYSRWIMLLLWTVTIMKYFTTPVCWFLCFHLWDGSCSLD